MKRLIYLTVVLMIVFICFGCSSMSAVGDQPFVGGSSPEARNVARVQMYGY